MYQVLFSINYQLCKEYPALTPWDIDNRSYHDVIILYGETRVVQIRTKKLTDPNRVIRRKAGDDWF